MNICLLTLEWPPYGGGIGTYMYNLARGLSKLDHSVTVITHDKTPQQLNRVKIVEVELPPIPGRITRKLFQWRWEPHHTWSQRAWQHYSELEKEYFFDIIETAEYGAWARHFIGNVKAPLVVKCHTPAQDVREMPLNGETKFKMPLWLSIENARERRQTVLADAISSPSYVLSSHISMSWAIPYCRITVLPNPVDTDLFQPPEIAGGRVSQRKKEILYVGRFQYNKGVFDLIESVKPLFAEHPDLTVHFIGQDTKAPLHISNSGKMTSEELLSRVSKKHRPRVIMTGWLPHSELVLRLQKAMIAVVPSRSFESFSYTVVENMACGTAVVATHCGGPAEIISHGVDGLLIPPGDISALTSALKQLTENPSLCEKLGHMAKRKVEENFSTSVIAPRTANWYQKIIDDYNKEEHIHLPAAHSNE
jgi:glycosyltransferase involved in cell wall biosynthesis